MQRDVRVMVLEHRARKRLDLGEESRRPAEGFPSGGRSFNA